MFRLSKSNLEWLWAELSLAVRQEKSVPGALDKLSQRAFEGPRARLAQQLAAAVNSGKPLSQAVAEQGRRFPPGTAEILAAGERTGRLSEVLDSLAQDARMVDTLRYNITYAILYPCILALFALGLLVYMRVVVFPMFYRMFVELDVCLPTLTLLMPTIAQVEIGVLLIFPALVLMVLYVMPFTIPVALDGMRLKVPVIGRLIHRMLLARWCRMAGLLFSAGVPEPEAVRIIGRASGNRIVQKMADRMALRLEAGEPLEQVMATEHFFFPPMLTWSAGAASASGGHARIWPMAEELYRRQAQTRSVVVSAVLRLYFPLVVYQVIGLALVALFLPFTKIFWSIG